MTTADLATSVQRWGPRRLASAPWPTIAAGALALALSVALPPPASADSTSPTGTLPTLRYGTAAVWTGDDAFVIGGFTGAAPVDEIVRYRPSTHTVTTMQSRLPTPRWGVAAVWDGAQHLYILGGGQLPGGSLPTDILRYTPALDRLEVMGATLPGGRAAAGVVWTGEHLYVIGGRTAAGNTDEILRYTPATDTMEVMETRLPQPRYDMSAVWDGEQAYLFGGRESHDGFPRQVHEIVRYDPASGALTVMDAQLPTDRYRDGTVAVWDGAAAQLLIEAPGLDPMQVARYDPSADTITTAPIDLQSRIGFSAVWAGDRVWLFGGRQDWRTGGRTLDDIVSYRPGDGTVATAGMLPWPSDSASAVWHDGHAYILGGSHAGTRRLIVRYDPATNAVQTMGAQLPYGIKQSSAISDGAHVYLLGGSSSLSGITDAILRYTPATDTLTEMDATLPTPRAGTSAVWDGQHAYIFGGFTGTGARTDEIVRYTPSTGGMAVLDARLPSPRIWTAAAWDGEHAYLFGGRAGEELFDEIVRFTPSTGQVTVMDARLPGGRVAMSAVHDGRGGVLLFGGTTRGDPGILRYDTRTGTLTQMDGRLPVGLVSTTAVWDGTDAYVFGGAEQWAVRRHVLRYTLEPGAPRQVSADPGPRRGEVTVRWDSPAPNSYLSLDGYNVYGSDDGAAPRLLARVGAETTTFTDSGLADGAARYYVVRAYNDRGESPIRGAEGRSYSPPNAPTGAETAPGPGRGQITVRWTVPAGASHQAPSGYRVYARDASGAHVLTGETSASTTTFTEEGLEDGAVRSYVVTAVNVAGEGSRFAEVSGNAYSQPDPPRDVAATLGPGVHDTTITWRRPAGSSTNPPTAYRVYRRAGERDAELLTEVAAAVTRHIDASCPVATFCHYTVTAVNPAGEGVASAEVQTIGRALP